ncbi:hypothetical protein L6164_037093 [Bauhinia variegata]|uniref:Uncharacterized protein n=1 Tax=Bauhinia variegata TaxID=167791 RepID=A0ACB9KJ10_BAUVA|nr:hypothetical protein L6164_037093 [Bauhinia variegata]
MFEIFDIGVLKRSVAKIEVTAQQQNLKFQKRGETEMSSIKGFYRQKKNAKPSTAKSSKSAASSKKSPAHAATFGSDVTQPPALISYGGAADLKDDHNEHEEMLQQFDMNMAYGPCLGMSRLARWERAHKLGLNPPEEIEKHLRSGKVQSECLWDNRI